VVGSDRHNNTAGIESGFGRLAGFLELCRLFFCDDTASLSEKSSRPRDSPEWSLWESRDSCFLCLGTRFVLCLREKLSTESLDAARKNESKRSSRKEDDPGVVGKGIRFNELGTTAVLQ
jgi:hypothetical protein